MKLEIFSCDHCGLQTQPSGIVTFVEVVFGGKGAAEDKIVGIDLCRGCYGKLVSAIREATSKLPPANRNTEAG